jgi:hypothetical protein
MAMRKLKPIGWLLILACFAHAAGGGCARKHTATAYLRLAPGQAKPGSSGSKDDPAAAFDFFCTTAQSLVTDPQVISAALADPKLKDRPCVARQDNYVWLAGEIQVAMDPKSSDIMQISATEPDRDDAAAIVNAVVRAYMNEIVLAPRQRERERLSELQKIVAEKQSAVRSKREQLKRELDGSPAGGTNSAATTLLKAEIENIEHVLRMVAEEQETLEAEVEAKPRVTVLGDPDSPAECRD